MNTTNLNPNITLPNGYNRIKHSKASEEYIVVEFKYQEIIWKGWIPLEYRRTGVSIPYNKTNQSDVNAYLNLVYENMNPVNHETWLNDQNGFWEDSKAKVTKPFFECLKTGGWKCVKCTLPSNPNWARRIQDLKEMGYILSTNTNQFCNNCKENTTHLLLVPIKRGNLLGNGYETWSKELRKRILAVLNNIDVYENKFNTHVLPDHKFSEIRWDDNTKSQNPDDMTDDEIKQKFQLLSNQRNQQKREVCRTCFQTGKRGVIFGIPFWYKGTADWDKSIPTKGKNAEQGCIGCAWYDIEAWRNELVKRLK
ncbi:TPA: restriction endonuclease [Neisseria meningitidis]